MDPRFLRRLINRHGSVGYIIVGGFLLANFLFTRAGYRLLLLFAGIAIASRLGLASLHSTGSCSPHILLSVAPVTYIVLDLGTLPGYKESFGVSINSKGVITGTAYGKEYDYPHSFIWREGKMTDIGTLGGPNCTAERIDEAGNVVGSSSLAFGGDHAFFWQNGKMHDLGTFGGSFSSAYGINSSGQGVGRSDTPNKGIHAFLWEDGKMHDISAQCPGTRNVAVDINETGQIIGRYYTNQGFGSFLYWRGKVQILPTLGGDNCITAKISDKGEIVGNSTLQPGNPETHAFVWRQERMHDLGTLGGEHSHASCINNGQQIVGNSETVGGSQHAVLWDDGKIKDLNRLLPRNSGWILEDATSINDKGWITGTGKLNGKVRAFLLKPTQ